MGRLVLAGLLCAASVGVAAAGPTRKVQVETEPPGATVYINDTADGPACDATPCTINAPLGTPTIIIRLDKYEPVVEPLDVTRGKKALVAKWKLRSALGTFTFDAPKGASVLVDDEDKGKIPVEVEVSAEPHRVVVKQGGKTLYDEIVEVAVGDEVPIKVKGAATTVAAGDDGDTGDGEGDGDGSGADDGDGKGGGGGGGESGGGETGITGSTVAEPRAQFLTAALAFDVGFRRVTYDNAMTANLRTESEDGQVMAGPAVELFPMRLLGTSRFRGLSLFVRAEFGLHPQQLTYKMMPLYGTVTTFWASYEASARYRWMIGTGFAVEASGGYARDQMQFNATDARDVDSLPDAIYQSLRLGGKASLLTGKTELYLTAENRIVFSGGALESRFDTAKASGLRAGLGAITKFGPILVRVEAALMHYSWTFTYDGANDTAQASGATDSVRLISMLAGYVY
jgi:hypothetical protein